MSRYHSLAFFFAALVITSLACGTLPGAGPTSTPRVRSAEISELKNEVQARDQKDAQWQAATEGQTLVEGGSVKTGDESRARVDISDGTIMRLADNTEFQLTTLSPESTPPLTTTLSLVIGKLWVEVTQALGAGNFEIETPNGTATVRGSFMSAAYFPDNGHFIVSCLEGLCRLIGLSGKFTDLHAGEQSEIPGFGQDPTPPQPIDESELADWATEFPEARTFTATTTPGPRPTETPPSGGGSAGQTACDHPYFPLRPGATWTYVSAESSTTWTVTGVAGDQSNATAQLDVNVQSAAGSAQITYEWQCDSAGINSYQFGTLGISQSGQVANFTMDSHSGTFLPSADLLVPGYSWNNAYTILYDFTVEGNSFPVTLSRSDDYTVTGTEPVTVVGGQTFDGIQISGNGSSEMQFKIPGLTSGPTQMADQANLVLARGVGLVRWDSTSEGTTSVSELTSYQIP